MPKPFTDLSLQKLPEGLHFDGKLPAFGIRIGKNRKTWLVVRGENRTKVRLGHYPTLSLAEARKQAMVALGSPMESTPAPLFPDALAAFLAQGNWRPRSRKVIESSLRHFSWKRPIDKISHEDVATALEAIDGKSARAHALKDIRAFFNWTIPRYLKYSPCQGLKMGKQPSRSRILTDAELKAVWIASEPLGQFGAITRLLILMGQRRGETAALELPWVKETEVTLPEHITKNGREHTFPIIPTVLGLIPLAIGNKRFTNWQRQKKKLDEASGVTGWTLHDLRRTYRTIHARIGTPPHIAERLVNHITAQTDMERIYDQYKYMPEMRLAVAAFEAWFDANIAKA